MACDAASFFSRFARLYWRVRIETLPDWVFGTSLLVSPAFIGGCGLKPLSLHLALLAVMVSPAFIGGCGLKQVWDRFSTTNLRFARLYWRVRIETPTFAPAEPSAAVFRPPLLAGAD